VGPKGRGRVGRPLVEEMIVEPDTGDKVLVPLNGLRVAGPLHEGPRSLGDRHAGFEAHGVSDVAHADGADNWNVVDGHPEVIKPARAKLVVFKAKNQSVLVVFPKRALDEGADAAEESAVFQITDPPRGDTGRDPLLRSRPSVREGPQAWGLGPENIVVLQPR